ncbi:alpha/beta hydrolase [Subtercola lobariae]|uniref:Esterase n=1 Tax=Subtercola lobariae TaxID=1588641 RepID=A0A917EY48_9MICO|nr:alpha/beta hydrolase [Subtercola lobariae]GGF21215.1 esterase [Subtercola lobariae]
MSLSMTLTRGLLRLTPIRTATPEAMREAVAHRQPPAPVTRGLLKVAHVEELTVEGRPVIRLTPKHAPTRTGTGSATSTGTTAGTHLIYTHGGAFVFSILATHWQLLASIIEKTGVSITVPLYGLAPEHQFGEAYHVLDAIYDEAIARYGDRVFLSGDSAGGALALGQAIRARDAGKPRAAGIILFSPWVDATMSNPQVARLAPLDTMLGAAGLAEAGRWWAGAAGPKDSLVSPIFAELNDLPPVYTYQGDRDVLLADAKLLTKRIRAAGGQTELRIYRGGIHVFVGAPWTPEARRALRHVTSVLTAPALSD